MPVLDPKLKTWKYSRKKESVESLQNNSVGLWTFLDFFENFFKIESMYCIVCFEELYNLTKISKREPKLGRV